jgi:hypothetical protein
MMVLRFFGAYEGMKKDGARGRAMIVTLGLDPRELHLR